MQFETRMPFHLQLSQLPYAFYSTPIGAMGLSTLQAISIYIKMAVFAFVKNPVKAVSLQTSRAISIKTND